MTDLSNTPGPTNTKAIILQQLYNFPSNPYVDMLALAYPRHLRYANRWNFDYYVMHGNVVEEWDIKYGGWAKLRLILDALKAGYNYVVWLGIDTLIVDTETDLREAQKESRGIGLVEHPTSGNVPNCDAMYITNSPEVIEFISAWIDWFPGPIKGWHEQAMLNLLTLTPEGIRVLYPIHPKWNSTVKGGCHVDNAVVEGFHGEGPAENRLRLMKACLRMCDKKEREKVSRP